ncbi:ATP-binding cassette domain-containing protein [Saccharopolyspora sp. MS10]|uniref:ATP-binding cassette domain-containing protein n=1 Tax=Saccharopolyspora sp. MS10 TaxID=3385973 RepID=UPI0039A24313
MFEAPTPLNAPEPIHLSRADGPRPIRLPTPAPAPVPLLEARRVTVPPEVLDADFALPRGGVAELRGPSGAARTALLRVLAGLRRPECGEVLLDGVRLDLLDDHELRELRRREFGFVLGDAMLVPELTAAENCALPQMLAGAERAEAMVRAVAVLRDFGLSGLRDRFPGQLSAAHQQLLTVARAVAHRPKVLFADVPDLSGPAIAELLDAARHEGIAVVLTTALPALPGRAPLPLEITGRALELAA